MMYQPRCVWLLMTGYLVAHIKNKLQGKENNCVEIADCKKSPYQKGGILRCRPRQYPLASSALVMITYSWIALVDNSKLSLLIGHEL